MFTDSPVVRSPGPRILFMLGAMLTAFLLLWLHQLRLDGETPGLTPIFYVLFAFEDYSSTVCALLILGVAVFVAGRIPATVLLKTAGEHPGILALASTVVLALGALFVYHNHPLSMDEYAAYFQSRIFAAGHLTGRFPQDQLNWLIPPGFQNFFISVAPRTGEVASAYWPGHALLMAPFTAVGIPWACNPVLSGLTVLVMHRLALQMFGTLEAAGLAVLLTIASPVFFGLGISYYSMPAHLLCNALFALLLMSLTPWRALAAGVVGSVALCLHNPVPHMLFAAPWLIWVLTRRGGVRLFGLMLLGYLPLCALLGIGWFELTNHLRDATTHAVATGAMSHLQSNLSVFALPTSPVMLARGMGVAKVWVWAVPGMLILAACAAWRWRANTFCVLFTLSALITLIGYIFLPQDQGHGWGYRYFHSAWMALPLLATAALYRPVGEGAVAPSAAAPLRLFEDAETRSYLVACLVLTLFAGVGVRAWEMQEFMAYDLSQLPHYKGTEQRVEILDDANSFYGADLVQNDPWLRGPLIRMYSHGADADVQLMKRDYPQLHLVYGDRHGTVWSAAAVSAPPARAAAKRP